jgi:DNA-binding transcriptional LysR family regulator
MRILDPALLQTFVLLAETGSFTRTAQKVLRGQSAISLQLKRLEQQVGEQLLVREAGGGGVQLTPAGEQLLGYARRLLALQEEALGAVGGGVPLVGKVRLGTPEDFATTHLPEVLARFAEAYPAVALEVTCDLTLNLLEQFKDGAFDLVLVKREPATRAARGVRVWREPLQWVSGRREAPERGEEIPLVVSPEPCVYRKRAIKALRQAGRRWRIAYSCASLAGNLAAVRAGLGITVLPREMVPPGLIRLEPRADLPMLPETEIALLQSKQLTSPAKRLATHIVRSLEAA